MKRSVIEFMKKTRFMTSEDTEKEAAKFHCTICGEPFSSWDVEDALDFERWIGPGSRYAGRHVRISFCQSCFDNLLDELRPQCKEDPVVWIEDLDDEWD